METTALNFLLSYNTAMVFLSVLGLGVASGVTGTVLLLRRRALVVDTLSHSTLPGLCISYLIFVAYYSFERSLPLLLFGALLAAFVASFTIQFLRNNSKLSEDLIIGIVLSVFFGFGIVLLSIIQNLGAGSEGGLHQFIYGQAAAMGANDALMMLLSALAAVLVVYIFSKELRLLCFDPEFATTTGFSKSVLDILLLSLTSLVVVVGLQAVGALLMVAFLIIPAVSARFWTERFKPMLVISGVVGALSGAIGGMISAISPNFPTGAVIVLVAGGFFLVSFLLAPERGLLAAIYRRVALKIRVGEDHILREMLERSSERASHAIPLSDLIAREDLSFFEFRLTLHNLKRRGYVQLVSDSLLFTPDGQARAKRLVEGHIMWEEYLAKHSALDAPHLHYSADLAEHALGDVLRERLREDIKEEK